MVKAQPHFPHHAYFLGKVWQKANVKKEDVLIMITGGRRKGKSWLSVHLAYELDPTFRANTKQEAEVYNSSS